MFTENELSGAVVAASIRVHTSLGPGLLESVYESCLAFKLRQNGFKVEQQKGIPLLFEAVKLECGFRCDLLIEDKLIVEIKAVECLNVIHLAQVLTYLKLANVKLGLLLNFNVLRMKNGIKRVVNSL